MFQCPSCGSSLSDFWLPNPIVKKSSFISGRRCFVLRPTSKSLWKYTKRCPLHIGVCDSHGKVCSFDADGVSVQKNWKDVLVVPVEVPVALELWDQGWKQHLKREKKMFKKKGKKNHGKYDAKENNCFDFAMRFLDLIHPMGEGKKHDKRFFSRFFLCELVGRFELWLKAEQMLSVGQSVMLVENLEEKRKIIHTTEKTKKNQKGFVWCDWCGDGVVEGLVVMQCTECKSQLCAACKETQGNLRPCGEGEGRKHKYLILKDEM